ncbi:hypothetical protein ACOSP7_009704 [Xanthoceras sorbifolium]
MDTRAEKYSSNIGTNSKSCMPSHQLDIDEVAKKNGSRASKRDDKSFTLDKGKTSFCGRWEEAEYNMGDIFISGGSTELFPASQVRHLDYCSSNHRPLLITIKSGVDSTTMDNIKWGQRFHFESRWAETEDYLNLIKSRWVNSDIPNRIQQVFEKLRWCAKSLDVWN